MTELCSCSFRRSSSFLLCYHIQNFLENVLKLTPLSVWLCHPATYSSSCWLILLKIADETWSDDSVSSLCLPGRGCTHIFLKTSQSAMISKPLSLTHTVQLLLFSLKIVICQFCLSARSVCQHVCSSVSVCVLFVLSADVWDRSQFLFVFLCFNKVLNSW